MLKPLILLSSDASLYHNTFNMMHRYSWSLYHPISTYRDYLHSKTGGLGHHILIHIIVMVCIRCSGLSGKKLNANPPTLHFLLPQYMQNWDYGDRSLVRLHGICGVSACFVTMYQKERDLEVLQPLIHASKLSS